MVLHCSSMHVPYAPCFRHNPFTDFASVVQPERIGGGHNQHSERKSALTEAGRQASRQAGWWSTEHLHSFVYESCCTRRWNACFSVTVEQVLAKTKEVCGVSQPLLTFNLAVSGTSMRHAHATLAACVGAAVVSNTNSERAVFSAQVKPQRIADATVKVALILAVHDALQLCDLRIILTAIYVAAQGWQC